jgi:tetratricopeptide (TPR) repeat protein
MISSANQQIQANPASFAGYAMRAMGEAAGGQNDLAVADLQRSLSLKPGNAPSYSVYAMIAIKAGHYQQAVDYADKALAAHPHLFNALQIKAGAYEKLGRMDMVQQVKAEFTAERNRRGAAYENDLGFDDPPAAMSAPCSNTFTQTQNPWRPPANNALLNTQPIQAPAGFSNSSGNSNNLFGKPRPNFSSVFGAPSTLITPAKNSDLFGGSGK